MQGGLALDAWCVLKQWSCGWGVGLSVFHFGRSRDEFRSEFVLTTCPRARQKGASVLEASTHS